jgi:hypothetical protein
MLETAVRRAEIEKLHNELPVFWPHSAYVVVRERGLLQFRHFGRYIEVGVKDYTLRSFMVCAPHQMLLGDPSKKKEMGWECGMYGGRRVAYRGLGGET